MLQWLRNCIEELRKPENLFTIVGVLVSLMLAILGVVGADNITALAGIVAVLATLAVSQVLVNIRIAAQSDQMEDVSTKLSQLEKSLKFRIFRGRDKPIKYMDDFEGARKEMLMAGVTFCQALGIKMKYALLKKIEDGCRFRIILLNPESKNGLEVASELSYEYGGDADRLKRDIESTLENLSSNIYPHAKPGQIQVRLLDAHPRYGLQVTDSDDKQSALARVEFSLYQLPAGERPNFYLSQQNDSDWFKAFRDQFEEMWNSATPWEP